MRRLGLMAAVMLAGCGATDGTRPWDMNRDGLITACEGLNRATCVSTSGCQLVPGGATPALRAAQGCYDIEVDVCAPIPPAPLDCSALPVALCGFVPECEVVVSEPCVYAASRPDGAAQPPPANCQAQPRCVNRAPPACESLDADACLAQPGCALEAPVCAAVCKDDGQGGCLPCEAPAPRCVTVSPPPPPTCESLDADACLAQPGCALEAPVCVAVCEDDGHGGCLPCDLAPRCVTVSPPPPPTCESLDADACLAQPGCALETPVCVAVCEDDGQGGCLPCKAPAPRCVTVSPPPPDACADLSDAECSATEGCALMTPACPAICEDDGHGGCLPCPSATPRCVAVPGPTPPPAP